MGTHLISFSKRFKNYLEDIKKSKYSQNIFALFILLVSMLFIFTPFRSQEFSYQWVPSNDGNEVRITLIDTNPNYFELQIPCELFTEDSSWIIEAKGGKALLLSLKENGLTLTLGSKIYDEVSLIELEKKFSNCEFAYFTYSSTSREVSLKANNESVNQVIPDDLVFEIASYLLWNPEISSENVQILIKTKPNLLIIPGKLKTFMINIFYLTILLGIAVLIFKNFKRNKIKLYKSEIISLIFLIFLGLVIYPMADDGFYLLGAKVFKETGILTQYQYPVPFPVGYLHASINAIFIQEFTSIFMLRIFPLLAALIIWMVFLRNWIHGHINITFREKLLLWSIWALFTSAFYVTLRAEPYVALFFIIAIAFLKRYQNDRPDLVIFLTVPLAVFSVSFHQSGIIVPFALLPIWIVNTFRLDWRKLNYSYFSLSFFISSTVLFINSDPLLLVSKVKDFESVLNWNQPFPGEFAWGYPPWKEYVRLQHVMNATPLQLLAILIFFIVLAFLVQIFITQIKNFDTGAFNRNYILIALITAPLGLIFAPSKWAGHYSPLLIVTLIGLTVLIKEKNKIHLLYFIALLAGSITFLRPWVAGGNNGYSFDLNNIFILEIYYYFVENRINFLLVIIVVGILLLTTLFRKYSYYLKIMIILILISILKQIIPPTFDSIAGDAGWTMNRQIASGVINKDARCGIFNEEKLIQLNILNSDKFLLNGDFINSPCVEPVGFRYGVWEYPKYSIGPVPLWDQQRLGNRSKINKVYCFEPLSRFYNPNLETCIYSWSSEIPEMQLLG
jgi:hypothetical protein